VADDYFRASFTSISDLDAMEGAAVGDSPGSSSRKTEATDPAAPTFSIGAADRRMKNNGFAGARRSPCVRYWAICVT
jgi:hypothetical protein